MIYIEIYRSELIGCLTYLISKCFIVNHQPDVFLELCVTSGESA